MSTKKPISPAGVRQSPNFPSAMRWGQLVFTSGVTATDEQGNIIGPGNCAEQTEAVMRKLKTILEAAGSGMEHVVKITAYLSKKEDYDNYNSVRAKCLPENPPASMLLICELLRPEFLVEVDAVAIVPDET